MLMIRTLGRVPGVLSLARGLTDAPTVIVFVALSIGLARVNDTIHAFVAFAIAKIVINAEARAAARTATLTLVVPRKGISTREPAAALVACVRTLASVQFRVSFQIV